MEDYDLGKTIETDKKFRFLNDTDGSTPAQQYSRLAADTMASYFESATKLRENGTPTLHGFNYSRFIDDFEKLVDAKFRSELDDAEKPERTHKAFFKVNEGVVEEIGIDEMLAQRLNEDLNKNITSQKSEIHTESKEINPPDLKINQ